jgi:hypothetical protein
MSSFEEIRTRNELATGMMVDDDFGRQRARDCMGWLSIVVVAQANDPSKISKPVRLGLFASPLEAYVVYRVFRAIPEAERTKPLPEPLRSIVRRMVYGAAEWVIINRPGERIEPLERTFPNGPPEVPEWVCPPFASETDFTFPAEEFMRSWKPMKPEALPENTAVRVIPEETEGEKDAHAIADVEGGKALKYDMGADDTAWDSGGTNMVVPIVSSTAGISETLDASVSTAVECKTRSTRVHALRKCTCHFPLSAGGSEIPCGLPSCMLPNVLSYASVDRFSIPASLGISTPHSTTLGRADVATYPIDPLAPCNLLFVSALHPLPMVRRRTILPPQAGGGAAHRGLVAAHFRPVQPQPLGPAKQGMNLAAPSAFPVYGADTLPTSVAEFVHQGDDTNLEALTHEDVQRQAWLEASRLPPRAQGARDWMPLDAEQPPHTYRSLPIQPVLSDTLKALIDGWNAPSATELSTGDGGGRELPTPGWRMQAQALPPSRSYTLGEEVMDPLHSPGVQSQSQSQQDGSLSQTTVGSASTTAAPFIDERAERRRRKEERRRKRNFERQESSQRGSQSSRHDINNINGFDGSLSQTQPDDFRW